MKAARKDTSVQTSKEALAISVVLSQKHMYLLWTVTVTLYLFLLQ